MHLSDRHPEFRARALDVPLVPADGLPALVVPRPGVRRRAVRRSVVLFRGRRACVRCGHETYSLRRHYPVTGSAVGAAFPVRMYGDQRPLSPVLRAPACAKVPPR
ncbi:hypothetical protein SPW_4729 [Streptomyces sp. W007]|nr:hypothetical protein SPW_4729 [Streptomyces sp. W007]